MKNEYTHVCTGYEDIIYDKNGRAYVYSPSIEFTKITAENEEVPF